MEDGRISIQEAIKFLNSRKISTPDEFEEILENEMGKFPTYSHFATHYNLEACIETAKLWKPYIKDGQFDCLVCSQVKKLYRIGCSVLSTNTATKSYVGNFVEVTELPTDHLMTKVTLAGDALYSRKGAGFQYVSVEEY